MNAGRVSRVGASQPQPPTPSMPPSPSPRSIPYERLVLPVLACAALSGAALAQEGEPSGASAHPPTPGEPVPQERTEPTRPPGILVVTPSRHGEALFDAPVSTDVVDAEQLERRVYRTLPQALRDVPGVFVQETSTGHGSPYIRGFTAQQNLLLIDGIRLNNSVLRPGPNQYWNTLDPFTVERLEIVKGPSSVLYGSDAIGGTVQAITKSPYAYAAPRGHAGLLHYRVASAEESHVGRAEVSTVLGRNTGLLLGVTGKHLGDVRAGGGTGEQPYTGYDDWAGDVKLEHFLDDDLRLIAAHQRVQQRGVPRTHSTLFAKSFEGTALGTDRRREFDQDRELSYLQLRGERLEGSVDELTLSLSWHRQEEVEDRIRGNGRRDLQGFDVNTLGLWAALGSRTELGHWTYGAELYRDWVDSFSERFAQQTPADDIQGPVGDDATYDLVGVFLQNEFPLAERLDLTLGGRFSYAAVDARSVRDPLTDQRISVEDSWNSVVGSARFVYALEPERWNLFGGVSQGFRAPNLTDMTRFDSAASDEFEIPATDLDPERFVQYELGLRHRTPELAAQVALFFTDISGAIRRVPTGNVNADGEREVTKGNVGDGYVWGLELGGAYRFHPRWEVFGHLAWLRSSVDTYPTSDPVAVSEPLDKEMPAMAQLGLRWDDARADLWAETLVTFADDADRLSSRDVADTQRIPPGGTPSWFTWDVRAGKRFAGGLDLTLAIENLLDEDYRVHGSGQNRPGTNAVLAATLSF